MDIFHNASSPAAGDSKSQPNCQPSDLSDIPANVFGGDTNNIYGHFCDGWVKGTELKVTVDAAGNNRDVETHLDRRTPPPDTDAWFHYNFDLSFEPTDNSKDCVLDCRGSFAQMATACHNSGSE